MKHVPPWQSMFNATIDFLEHADPRSLQEKQPCTVQSDDLHVAFIANSWSLVLLFHVQKGAFHCRNCNMSKYGWHMQQSASMAGCMTYRYRTYMTTVNSCIQHCQRICALYTCKHAICIGLSTPVMDIDWCKLNNTAGGCILDAQTLGCWFVLWT